MSSLPTPLTRFVGRAAELAEAAALLADERLLTLTGPGGAGKTRLALRLAAAVAAKFPEGAWFVDLSSLSGSEFVWDQVATVLGVTPSGAAMTVPDAVVRRVVGWRALVVLDNCEHVVVAAAEVVGAVLAAAPAMKFVATSREPLGVGGEVTWTVPPLSEADGVELFTTRAKQARPRLRLHEDESAAVRSICRHLDGLPLAIELAAARSRALSPSLIAAHLHDHLRVLPRGPRTAPSRQATLRASFEWSQELLSPAERALLRQLSVFAGAFDVEAALAVCPSASIELVASLADRSLIVVDESVERAEPRYRMLATIREYAAEQLAESGDAGLIHTRHRDHYLALSETAEPEMFGKDERRWRARLRTELDNVRAALAWSRDTGDAEALARMVTALAWFWTRPGGFAEFQMWLQAAADRADDVSPRVRARIRNLECLVQLSMTGSLVNVPVLANEALALARQVGDVREEATALFLLGVPAGFAGGAEAMRPYIEQALPLMRSSGFVHGAASALTYFVMLRLFQSDPEEPRRLIAEAVAIAREGADLHTQLFSRGFAGFLALIQGRLTEATQIFEIVVADGRETNDSNFMHGLLGLAWVRIYHGDFGAARAAIEESLATTHGPEAEVGSVRAVEPLARWLVGWMQLAEGNAAQARDTLAAVVDAVRPSIGARFLLGVPFVTLAQAQLTLGARDEAAASLDEATALARSGAQTWVLGRAGLIQARLCARERNLQGAESLAHEALGLAREASDPLGVVDGLELLAWLAAEQSSPREAVRLWAAAESRRAELGYARFPADRPAHEAALDAAKQALGEEFATAWAEGAALSVDDAIAYAARGRGERRRPATGWASLTPTELEVARLVGQHLSNPDIAERMFVSRATVKTHLVHMYAKLGIDSRSELAAQAIQRGVVR
jgi:predicted ATPase/DNA-binding CsgD family transcriptional regulator